LTLGVLAELKQRFAAGGLIELASRFENGKLSAGDLIAVIACGLRGAGATYSDDKVAALKVVGGLHTYVRIAADLFGRDVRRRSAGSGDERKPSAAAGRLTSKPCCARCFV
jgi:hypothetical protein